MANCDLYFSNFQDPELFRLVFSAPGTSEQVVAVRGKTPNGFKATTNFQWTSAVRALCALLLKELIAQIDPAVERQTQIEGSRGSYATSLDYALGRQPLWLREMFGQDTFGKPLVRRLFSRSNPGQRRVAPVSIQLNRARWVEIPIRVFVNSTELKNIVELLALLKAIQRTEVKQDNKKIELSFSRSSPTAIGALVPDRYEEIRQNLRGPFDRALTFGLKAVNPFNRAGIAAFIQQVSSSKAFAKVAGSRMKELSNFTAPAQAQHRLALQDSVERSIACLQARDSISVMVPIPMIGSMAIFYYLKLYCAVPLNIRSEYPHAVFVANNFEKGNFLGHPDLLAVGVGPAATILGSRRCANYKPIFPMPRMSAKVFESNRARSDSKVSKSRYVLLNDEPSNPQFLFQDLEVAGLTKGKPIHAEIDETLDYLDSDSSLRSIIFFPFDELNIKFNSCREVSIPEHCFKADQLLFLRQELAEDTIFKDSLAILIRHAWLELLSSAKLRREITDSILGDDNIIRLIYRASGLYTKDLAA